MEATGKDLVNHWSWAAEKGLMNAKTAATLKSACMQVLSCVGEDWEDTDVQQLKPDEMFRRFQNLRRKDFTPGSLRVYGHRFKQAVESFLKYVDNPASWKPPGDQRPLRQAQAAARKRTNVATTRDDNLENEPLPSSALRFEVPIPGKGSARFFLPVGMTAKDVEMVDEMLRAYVKRASAQSEGSAGSH